MTADQKPKQNLSITDASGHGPASCSFGSEHSQRVLLAHLVGDAGPRQLHEFQRAACSAGMSGTTAMG